MRNIRLSSLLLASTFILMSSGAVLPVEAQGNGSGTSMMLLRVIKTNGQKYLQTPTGETLPITGEHIEKDATAVAVYRDSGNNYWFIDKHGQPMSIPPEKVQWAINSVMQQRQMKQANGMPMGTQPYSGAPSQTTIINNPPSNGSSSSSSGMGMVGTGLAAAGGAMAGSMIGDAINDNGHYYGIPYGTPIYHDGANNPYYRNPQGNNVYVNNKHNENVMNQWNQQGDWNNRQNWSPANNPAANNPHPNANANNVAQNQDGQQKESRRQRRREGQNGGAASGQHEGGFGAASGQHEGWGGFSGGNLDQRSNTGGGGGRRFGGRRGR